MALKPRLVGEAFVNHDVENSGELLYGGSVKINRIGSVSLKDYDGSTITYSDMDTTAETLNIDHCKYEARQLDDVDAVQSRDGGQLISRYTEAMAVAIADDLDQETFKEIAGAATGANVYGDDTTPISITSSADAKALVLKLKSMADKANVPKEGRRLACSSDFSGMLLADPYINLSAPTAEDSLVAGYIGKLYGFEIFETNNLPETEGHNQQVVASHPLFTTEINQIQKMEALRLQDSFKDAVRCLSVSGRKTVYPEGVMKAVVSFS
jgi:hypothetical protein